MKISVERSDLLRSMSRAQAIVERRTTIPILSNVLIEAMACQTPCIATDVGESSYIVNKTGWLVPPNNSEKLSNSIKQAINEINSPYWKTRQKMRSNSMSNRQGEKHYPKMRRAVGEKKKDNKKFKPIKDYKPLGNLIYNEELLNKLENRLND